MWEQGWVGRQGNIRSRNAAGSTAPPRCLADGCFELVSDCFCLDSNNASRIDGCVLHRIDQSNFVFPTRSFLTLVVLVLEDVIPVQASERLDAFHKQIRKTATHCRTTYHRLILFVFADDRTIKLTSFPDVHFPFGREYIFAYSHTRVGEYRFAQNHIDPPSYQAFQTTTTRRITVIDA